MASLGWWGKWLLPPLRIIPELLLFQEFWPKTGDLGEVIAVFQRVTANMVKSRSLLAAMANWQTNTPNSRPGDWQTERFVGTETATVMATCGYFGTSEPHGLPLLNWHLLPMPSGSRTMSHLDGENDPTGPSSKNQAFTHDQNKVIPSSYHWFPLQHDQLLGCSGHVVFPHRVAKHTKQQGQGIFPTAGSCECTHHLGPAKAWWFQHSKHVPSFGSPKLQGPAESIILTFLT